MKTIEVDEDLYRYIASQTHHIGESASDILRRLLNVDGSQAEQKPATAKTIVVSKDVAVSALERTDIVKELRSLLISDEFAELKKAIDRFMLVLSTLYRLEPDRFAEATQVKGRKRVYFANDERTLRASGNTTKPKSIPNTPFWVITNTNTSRKRQMVEQVMTMMSIPAEVIEKVTNAI